MKRFSARRFLSAYAADSALNYRRASTLYYLHLAFIPMVAIFLAAAWLYQGYTSKIPVMIAMVVLLSINLALIRRGSFSLASLLTLVYSLVLLSATVYLADPPRHFLLYNMALFSVITLLLAGLISRRLLDSVVIGILSALLLSHYFFGRVVRAESVPLNEYVHNYVAVVLVVIIASVISAFINRQTNTLFAQLQGINESLEKTVEERSRALVESEKLAALGGMVGGISHEINTPIGNSVTVVSHLVAEFERLSERVAAGDLTRSGLEEFAASGLESVRAAERSLSTARNLVQNFRRIVTDIQHENPRPRDVREELESAVASMRGMLREYPSVTVDIRGPEHLEVMMYPGLLWQVLTQLISNSLIHGLAGGGSIIGISFSELPGGLEVLYSDDGIGMDEATLKQHFDPFFTTRRAQGSTGLGMNLVYNLLTTAGAKISAESAVGRGVLYRIEFPEI
jgi:signal transduction histidine kinase